MSERPSRGGPRPYYGHVAGSEDDSNNGNDSIEESEVETQLSISSESSIEYHDDDSDDHEGTGEGNDIESSSSDESEQHFEAKVATFVGLYSDVDRAMAIVYLRRNKNDLNDALSEFLEHSQVRIVASRSIKRNSHNNSIALLCFLYMNRLTH